jgi:DNA replication protein DnaC
LRECHLPATAGRRENGLGDQSRHRRGLERSARLLRDGCRLVVSEIGYLPISRMGAMLFLQLMARRYERVSTVLTPNKGFGEWGEICGDEVMAAALIGRPHHLVTIRGNNYRMRQHTDR